MIKEYSGVVNLTYGGPVKEFIVENYIDVTFNFFITTSAGFDNKHKQYPACVEAYLFFRGRFERIHGHKQQYGELEPGELFTYSNSDIAEGTKVILTKHPKCEWANVEVEIFKEPRNIMV